MALDLKIRLQPKQAQLYDFMSQSPATWIGWGGSRGGAKSGGIRRIMLSRRMDFPKTAGMIFRRTYPELLDNHITPMWREYPELEQHYNKGEKLLTLPNGSQIAFRYAENESAIDSFLGKEFMDVAIDQAEALSGDELIRLRTCCRWTGVPDAQCKFVVSFNPGGKGTEFLKRIFKTRMYRDGEVAEDYAFIQAYGWDNIEWVRPWLDSHSISEKAYYSQWSDSDRQKCFLGNSAYGRVMAALPPGLKAGWLYGDFDSFSGQYFDNFRPEIHVRRDVELGIEPWHERWIAIDWGFAHNCAVLWGAKTPSHVAVYDEIVRNRTDEDVIAAEIARKSQGQTITRIFLSPDATAKRGSAKPIKEQLGTALTQYGLPYPVDADNSRVAGWRLVYSMLGREAANGVEAKPPQLMIADHCTRLIAGLPMMSRDPKKPEDCEKFDANEQGEGGDDAADCLRYLVKSYFGDADPPREIQFAQHIGEIEAQNKAPLSSTAYHIQAMQFQQAWKASHGPLGRPVRRH